MNDDDSSSECATDAVDVHVRRSAVVKSSQHFDAMGSVFSTPDLLVDILCPLIDGDCLSTLSSLSLVSKSFHQATVSNQFWREMCYQRWKRKWGFHPRWEKALMDYYHHLNERKHETQFESRAADNFWMSRYFFEEQDATRSLIRGEELDLLVFDFRFWIGQPSHVDGRIVIKSGLLRSRSRRVRFTRSAQVLEGEDQSEEEEILGLTWSARGQITGHPCQEPGIEWFLNESSGVLQWGFTPNLWPQGTVQRLDNWGWQIQNPNVCLRSIDPLPPSPRMPKLSGWDDAKLDEIERECSKNQGQVDAGHTLWKDLIDSLENIPLRSAPLVNGSQVTADIPRAFIEHYDPVYFFS